MPACVRKDLQLQLLSIKIDSHNGEQKRRYGNEMKDKRARYVYLLDAINTR